MHLNEKFNEWTKAHVFYKLYLQPQKKDLNKVERQEHAWRMRNFKEAPQGKLLVNNSLFDGLQNDQTVHLLHVTTDLDNILESGALYSSGGCLVGSIYCTPLFLSDQHRGRFRIHNLGHYIFKKEMPMVLGKEGRAADKKITSLIIILHCPQEACGNLIGIDYLRLGDIHFALYQELSYLLSNAERTQLEKQIVSRIKNAVQFLSTARGVFYLDEKIDRESFFNQFLSAVDHLPILGYFYFEVLTEYFLLYLCDRETKKFAGRREFYNHHAKQMMFDLCPQLLENFTLGQFKPSPDQLSRYFKNKKAVFSKLDFNHFLNYLIERIIFLVNARLFSLEGEKIDFRSAHWSFGGVVDFAAPLVGHLIHRELRNFGRYPDFYFYFDQYKALQVWNFWNHHNIVVPFNGLIPKGEVGINPAYPDMTYEIFEGEVFCEKNGCWIEPRKKLDIEIVPRLVNPRHAFMRHKYYIRP